MFTGACAKSQISVTGTLERPRHERDGKVKLHRPAKSFTTTITRQQIIPQLLDES